MLIAGFVALLGPDAYLARRRRLLARQFRLVFPDFIDLVVVCVDAGLTLETASGRHFELDRGPGGLRARYRHKRGTEREWTVLGASRGESGILGEGIRQALLRDPTYIPAVSAARAMLP